VVDAIGLFSARLYSVEQEGGHRRLASSALSMLTITAASYLDPGWGLEWVRNSYNDGERCTELILIYATVRIRNDVGIELRGR
jgi:hypothetical protein